MKRRRAHFRPRGGKPHPPRAGEGGGRRAKKRRRVDLAEAAARAEAKERERTENAAEKKARIEKLKAQAWKLACRFGYLLDVEPALVFAPTRGQARTERVRHLVTHVLLEIDRGRSTEVAIAMRRDRSTSRNSFRRAWDHRDEESGALEALVVFIAESRRVKFNKLRRALEPGRRVLDATLKASGPNGRFTPQDFNRALAAAAQAIAMDAPRDPGAPATGLPLAQAPPPMPAAALLLDASPLTRKLLRGAEITGEANARGQARVSIIGHAVKCDLAQIGKRLAQVLDTAGFTTAVEGAFEVAGSKAWRLVLKTAPTAAFAAACFWRALAVQPGAEAEARRLAALVEPVANSFDATAPVFAGGLGRSG